MQPTWSCTTPCAVWFTAAAGAAPGPVPGGSAAGTRRDLGDAVGLTGDLDGAVGLPGDLRLASVTGLGLCGRLLGDVLIAPGRRGSPGRGGRGGRRGRLEPAESCSICASVRPE